MFSDDEILAEIKRVASKLGKSSLAQSEFNRHASFSGDTAAKHFGSWNAAVEAAGLDPIKPGPQVKAKRIDDDDLLLDLIRLYNEFGKPPTVAIISAKGRFS
ncbi:MAG: HNH endonuclease, partial [Deltaproteobacteria bacterium]|nr:HNH endonuclease [Deltaproteobacteria bacterium]